MNVLRSEISLDRSCFWGVIRHLSQEVSVEHALGFPILKGLSLRKLAREVKRFLNQNYVIFWISKLVFIV